MLNNLFPFESKITKAERFRLLNQKPKVIWFTGLSGSGKSTLATHLEFQLTAQKFKTYLLDGDNVRMGLNKDLDFSNDSRKENIRRISEVSNLLLDAGLVVLSAFISPFEEDRNQVRTIVGKSNFIEVFVDCPLQVCEERDVKGLYKKARLGEVKNFTGISSPYERPVNPDITIPTHLQSLDESLILLLDFIRPQISYS
ncbi:MAG: adenylyl-sulfate kinase [Cyclobacteriaceae bacterium]|nr:adenylyl-sulfate kinase [Cyclobacteriaceae bacterium]